jgi:quercetin dioxygenase-like cupin family protein
MLLDKLTQLGDLAVTMYTFEKAGDELPKHVHDKATVHITIVARGRVKVYSHDWEIEASAGQLLDFREGEPHGFIALEDDSRIFNIPKNVR